MKLAPLTVLVATAITAIGRAEPTIETSGVRVIREVHGEGFDGLKPFNAQKKGSALALIVRPGGGAIVKLNPRDATLEYFTDDKGTDLLLETKGFQKDGITPFERLSDDGQAAIVEIEGGGLPAKGATALKAKGTIKLQTASEKKPFRSEPFTPAAGAALTVGEISLKVKKVGEVEYGDHKFEVEFESNDRGIERIAEVRFLDPGGNVLDSKSSGSSSMGFGNKYTYGRSHTLAAKPDGELIVEFSLWTDFEDVELPFEVTAGLGG